MPGKSSPLRPDIIQRIAKISGAFVENYVEGEAKQTILSEPTEDPVKLKISHKSFDAFSRAERLIMRASVLVGCIFPCTNQSHQSQESPDACAPLLAHKFGPVRDVDTIFPKSYALYPFMSPRALPWTMGTSGAFRARRVSEWLGESDALGEAYGLCASDVNFISVNGYLDSTFNVTHSHLRPVT